jgi:haloalkane dehalogenase
MEFLRTPEGQFVDLPNFPYQPHYTKVLNNQARMHYLDEGGGEETLLCLHGEPSWSFLYRHIIAELKDSYRIIAPDLIGFGRSDKPAEIDDHTYHLHHQALFDFINRLDLTSLTLVCQDWGGILGLALAMKQRQRFDRLVIMNTGLPTGDIEPGAGFKQWREFAKSTGRALEPGRLIQQSALTDLPDDVIAAYDAPFPDESYRAGVAALPLLVPQKPDDPGTADIRQARTRLRNWHRPALVMFSDSDPITAGGDRFFRNLIPSATDQPAITIEGAGHFLQEEKGKEIAAQIRAFIERTPVDRPEKKTDHTVRIPTLSDILDDSEDTESD